MNDNCWIPPLEECSDLANWGAYQEILYAFFKADFIDSFPVYDNARVSVRHYPIEYGKEEAFFHITCKDYDRNGERVPDLRRCERIRWIRAFIENKCNPSICVD